MTELALPPLPSIVPDGTPLAHAVREYARQAVYAERPVETVPIEEYRRLVARCIELGEKIAALTQPTTVQPDDCNRKLRAQLEQEWSNLQQIRRAERPGDAQIEAAAKVIAQCMDYPWEHMPESGRNNMRKHAKAVIDAALKGMQPGERKDQA